MDEGGKLHVVMREISDLKDGHKLFSEKLDKKADKTDLESIIETLRETSKENREYLWKGFMAAISGVVGICGFFWYRTELINSRIEGYNQTVYEFKIEVLKVTASLEGRIDILEERLKGLELIK